MRVSRIVSIAVALLVFAAPVQQASAQGPLISMAAHLFLNGKLTKGKEQQTGAAKVTFTSTVTPLVGRSIAIIPGNEAEMLLSDRLTDFGLTITTPAQVGKLLAEAKFGPNLGTIGPAKETEAFLMICAATGVNLVLGSRADALLAFSCAQQEVVDNTKLRVAGAKTENEVLVAAGLAWADRIVTGINLGAAKPAQVSSAE